MMLNDKKKLAAIIIGKAQDSEEPCEHESKEYEGDMTKEALQFAMKGFMSAISDKDAEKALKTLKKIMYLLGDMPDEDKPKEDSEENDYTER